MQKPKSSLKKKEYLIPSYEMEKYLMKKKKSFLDFGDISMDTPCTIL